MREFLNQVLALMEAGAKLTTNVYDDVAVKVMRVLIESIDDEGNLIVGAADDPRLVGIDPAMVITIVDLVMKLIKMWKERK